MKPKTLTITTAIAAALVLASCEEKRPEPRVAETADEEEKEDGGGRFIYRGNPAVGSTHHVTPTPGTSTGFRSGASSGGSADGHSSSSHTVSRGGFGHTGHSSAAS